MRSKNFSLLSRTWGIDADLYFPMPQMHFYFRFPDSEVDYYSNHYSISLSFIFFSISIQSWKE